MPGPLYTQTFFTLPLLGRGSHLITEHVVSSVPAIKDVKCGLLHLFVQHTSCALAMNENWDSEVREDMSDALDGLVPENSMPNAGPGKGSGGYRHDAEGSDDMPAHIKAALIGSSVSIPITNGKLSTGTWQGIWFLEFRNGKQRRKCVATVQGERAQDS